MANKTNCAIIAPRYTNWFGAIQIAALQGSYRYTSITGNTVVLDGVIDQ